MRPGGKTIKRFDLLLFARQKISGIQTIAIESANLFTHYRSATAEYRLNPLTVLKGYQELVDEGLVEKKRGRGMFVTDGARKQLTKDERRRFVEKEWPKVLETIDRLGLDAAALLTRSAEATEIGSDDE